MKTRFKNGAGRDPEKLRANSRRWHQRHPDYYKPVPPAEKLANLRSAALARWQPGSTLYENARKRRLARDLKLLSWVVKGIRGRLELPEKNRRKALAHYHAKRKGQPRYNDRIKSLEKAFRRAVKPRAAEVDWRIKERVRLEKTAIRVFKRQGHPH